MFHDRYLRGGTHAGLEDVMSNVDEIRNLAESNDYPEDGLRAVVNKDDGDGCIHIHLCSDWDENEEGDNDIVLPDNENPVLDVPIGV
ncbi:hypothetical protein KEM54_006431 [Ascosphaera aggregata]|nr:hypothetical protein KEM54_006431 [Ascosphaera aggregata]